MELIHQLETTVWCKLKRCFTGLCAAWHYYRANNQRSYPLKIVGGKTNTETNETIIELKEFGYKSKLDMPIKKIFDDEDMLYRISPQDVVRVSTIAMCEAFFSLPDDEREDYIVRLRRKFLQELGE